MVNSISSGINSVRLLNAANAFKAANAAPKEEESFGPQVSEGTQVNDSLGLMKAVDVEDIKKYASMVGETNLSEDDIKYGLVYGRSVLSDWVV